MTAGPACQVAGACARGHDADLCSWRCRESSEHHQRKHFRLVVHVQYGLVRQPGPMSASWQDALSPWRECPAVSAFRRVQQLHARRGKQGHAQHFKSNASGRRVRTSFLASSAALPASVPPLLLPMTASFACVACTNAIVLCSRQNECSILTFMKLCDSDKVSA